MRLKIAARQSDLARIQAYAVGDALQAAWDDIDIDYLFRASLGDQNQHDPLWKMPSQGVFTEDFHRDLLEGNSDLVVHSWKDLPIEERQGTEIVATLPREDNRDMLLIPQANWQAVLDSGQLRVLSSSPRRQHNLLPFLTELFQPLGITISFHDVRGNISTRLGKAEAAEQGDALVVAKAALDRLLGADQQRFPGVAEEWRQRLDSCRWCVLPLSVNPAAAAQGALAIEVRSDNLELKRRLAAINDRSSQQLVETERAHHSRLGGGCHQKIGVSLIATRHRPILSIRGVSERGEHYQQFDWLEPYPAAPAPASASHCWPQDAAEQRRFAQRQPLPANNPGGNLFIPRAEALPADWQIDPQQILWTSGIRSWQKLLARGVWVNGCNDSLGEQQAFAIDQLAPGRWSKLSKPDAPTHQGMASVSTYELQWQADWQALRGKTHFYWMSGSLFQQALAALPELRQAEHFCNPGNTYDTICDTLGSDRQVHLRLGFQQWQQEMNL